ncbi:Holliday junction resolvase RecU [Metabacillus sp. Hm71]|uniref:Holliday junction resolvase RecU n=1 Tax=Metabacillus sp. Hm71 TaxID=3450743 RepID=UPI003F43AC52
MAKNNPGKIFEQDIETSCSEQNIFYYRIKDTFIPMELRKRVKVTKNDYDSFVYKYPNLFPIEFKSTQNKSFSFDEKIIKKHQIEALEKAATYDGLIAGFIFNFREYDNKTLFVHIEDFIKYKKCAEEGICEMEYVKVNKSSIPLEVCEQIGEPIHNVKKKIRYRYYINKLISSLIDKYSGGNHD